MTWETISEAVSFLADLSKAAAVLSLFVIVIKKWKHIIEAIRCVLRALMLHTYYKHKDEKRIRQYEFENFILLYNAYKALGGNSFIDKIHEEVTEWEVIT